MDVVNPLQFVFASFFVLGLLGLLALGLRYYGARKYGVKPHAQWGAQWGAKWPGARFAPAAAARLSVVETRYLSPQARLVLVRRDEVEHLLLMSGGNVSVIESGIQPLRQED